MCYEDFFSLFLDSITFFRAVKEAKVNPTLLFNLYYEATNKPLDLLGPAAKVAKPVQDPIFRIHAMNPSMQASNRVDEGEKSRFGSARQSEERIFNKKTQLWATAAANAEIFFTLPS